MRSYVTLHGGPYYTELQAVAHQLAGVTFVGQLAKTLPGVYQGTLRVLITSADQMLTQEIGQVQN